MFLVRQFFKFEICICDNLYLKQDTMSEVPEMFNVIEKLNKEYADLQAENERLKKEMDRKRDKYLNLQTYTNFIVESIEMNFDRAEFTEYTIEEFIEMCRNGWEDDFESRKEEGYLDNIVLEDDNEVSELIELYESIMADHGIHICGILNGSMEMINDNTIYVIVDNW